MSGAALESRAMRDQTITPELRQWIMEQVGLGHRPEAVLRSMCDTGWNRDTALTALEETIAAYLDDFAQRQLPPATRPVEHPPLAPAGNECWVEGHAVQVLASLHVPPVVMFGQVLSPAECEALVEEARPRMRHTPALPGTATTVPSTGVVFAPAETALCGLIERRIAGLLEEPLARCQGLQVVCCPAGAQYKPQEYLLDAASPAAGNRAPRRHLSVLLVYLNTPPQGGATVFPEIGLEIHPVRGNGVFFSLDQIDQHSRGLHTGAPVLRGEQWVLLKWIESAPATSLPASGQTSGAASTW